MDSINTSSYQFVAIRGSTFKFLLFFSIEIQNKKKSVNSVPTLCMQRSVEKVEKQIGIRTETFFYKCDIILLSNIPLHT